MSTLYNEIDRYCCDWLSNLMDAGLITAGVIDDRPIQELEPDDIRGYDRIHFFAGIAGWDLALRLAGWPATRPVWTGSCPCQPWSAAGQGKAADDKRHLWPDWYKLIRAVRPATVFGEQVESAIGWGWLDLVHADMATQGYATRFAILPACGVGAPHIRNRLWFVANDNENGRTLKCETWLHAHGQSGNNAVGCSAFDELADADAARCGAGRTREAGDDGAARIEPAGFCDDILGDSDKSRLPFRQCNEFPGSQRLEERRATEQPGRSPWADVEWIACSDGKTRPAKPGIFPLAHGISGRVGQLRAAGNAIVPQVAAEFIKASMIGDNTKCG